jgi:poly(A) polymerase
MLNEFQRADRILNEIATGKKTWKDLFERHTFFSKDHKHYLSVVAAARTKEAFEGWKGSVQAKFRLLVKGIDDSESGVALARPFPEGFKRTHRCKNEDEIDRVCQGNVEHVVKEEMTANGANDNSSENGEDGHTIYTCTFYVGITLDAGELYNVGTDSLYGSNRVVDAGKQLDISYPSSEFRRIVTSLPEYDANIMSVRVVYKRR